MSFSLNSDVNRTKREVNEPKPNPIKVSDKPDKPNSTKVSKEPEKQPTKNFRQHISKG